MNNVESVESGLVPNPAGLRPGRAIPHPSAQSMMKSLGLFDSIEEDQPTFSQGTYVPMPNCRTVAKEYNSTAIREFVRSNNANNGIDTLTRHSVRPAIPNRLATASESIEDDYAFIHATSGGARKDYSEKAIS